MECCHFTKQELYELFVKNTPSWRYFDWNSSFVCTGIDPTKLSVIVSGCKYAARNLQQQLQLCRRQQQLLEYALRKCLNIDHTQEIFFVVIVETYVDWLCLLHFFHSDVTLVTTSMKLDQHSNRLVRHHFYRKMHEMLSLHEAGTL